MVESKWVAGPRPPRQSWPRSPSRRRGKHRAKANRLRGRLGVLLHASPPLALASRRDHQFRFSKRFACAGIAENVVLAEEAERRATVLPDSHDHVVVRMRLLDDAAGLLFAQPRVGGPGRERVVVRLPKRQHEPG